MGVLIGMDEAGLGPNLGPFVVAVTVWEVPGRAERCDLYEKLQSVVSSVPCERGRLHVADSKQIFSPSRGLGALETAALTMLNLAGCEQRRFPDCLAEISHGVEVDEWMRQLEPLELPSECEVEAVLHHAGRLKAAMDDAWIRCRSIHVEMVFPELFNRRIAQADNKAAICSEFSMNLLRRVWNPEEETAFVVADRHGGRARYDQLLMQTFDGLLPMRMSETPELSRYRLGDSEVRFECRAERHFPVAVASLVAKYLRELSMRMFNAFWRTHVPDVRPTQGYPGDSRRFAEAVAPARAALGIPDHVFWRVR